MTTETQPTILSCQAMQGAFKRISRAIESSNALTDLLNLIASEASALVGASTVSIGLRDGSGQMLEMVAAHGENADEILGLRIIAQHALAINAIQAGSAAILDQQISGEELTHVGARRSVIVAPIMRDGSVTGAIFCTRGAEMGPFGESDGDILGVFAGQAALAIKCNDVYRTMSQKSREMAVLFETSRTVGSSLNVPEVLNSVLDTVCHHFEHHAAALFLLNDEKTHLFIVSERGLSEDEREIQLAASDSAISGPLQDGLPLIFHFRSDRDENHPLRISERTRCALAAPVRSGNDTLGLIIVASTQPEVYNDNDLELLAVVGTHSGIAIGNAWLYEEATRQAEEASALYDLSQHVNASLQLDRVLQFVADSVVNVLKVEKFALMLLDNRSQRLCTRVSRGVDESQFHKIQPRAGQGIPGWVLEWMTPTAVADVSADARNSSAPIHGEGITSAICVPMSVGNDALGVMLAMSARRRFFTVAEVELLYTIANQAAVAIANATLYKDARSKSTEMRRYFNRVARALGSALEAQDLPQLLADLVVEVMRADRSAIYRSDGDVVKLHATSRFRSLGGPDMEVPVGEGLTGWVARKGKALAVTSVSEDLRAKTHAWLSRERLASYLAVPLKLGRQTVGVVEIFTQEPRTFSDEEIKLLSQFARRARVAERLAPQPAP